jgi:hypothetical protein
MLRKIAAAGAGMEALPESKPLRRQYRVAANGVELGPSL